MESPLHRCCCQGCCQPRPPSLLSPSPSFTNAQCPSPSSSSSSCRRWTFSTNLFKITLCVMALLVPSCCHVHHHDIPQSPSTPSSGRLNQYIGHYEGLSYTSVPLVTPCIDSSSPASSCSNPGRHRRSVPDVEPGAPVAIDFKALGHKFELRLQPDADSVFAHDVRIEGSDGSAIPMDPSTLLYSGHMDNDKSCLVHGSLHDGLFEGRIITSNATYYVERSFKYLNQSDDEDDLNGMSPRIHSVIYSSDQVDHPLLNKQLGGGCPFGEKGKQVTQWMDSVSMSAINEDEADSKTLDPNHFKQNVAKDRWRRDASLNPDPLTGGRPSSNSGLSNGGGINSGGGTIGGAPNLNLNLNLGGMGQGTRPGFSHSSRDHQKEDGLWIRNAQSRISHQDRKDFYSPPPLSHGNLPSTTISKRACSLYIQTDTYLWEHIRKDASTDSKAREEIASLVAQHIKAVNHIYENSDFNGIRGLKFIVQRLKINDTSSCDTQNKRDHNPFCSPNIDVSNFLNLNSQFNHNDFCLAYIFTYRDFSGGTLGLAWVASTSGASGGICEKYKSYTENIHGRQVQTKRSLNTGIITFVNYNSRVPPKVSELTLAHEIGHNFGSPHDFPGDCRPGGTMGNFIMYSSATSGERPNNNKFSPCSIRNISSVLSAVFNSEGKENCFKEDNGPFCGNKIVEDGEECDCGYDQKECTESCCYPREVEPYRDQDPNARPCTRRKTAICSPSEGPCCSEKCRYEPNYKLCRSETECTLKSFCNGYRAMCPSAPSKQNKTECNGGTQVCWAGSCVGSICQKYEMEECFLTSRSGSKPDEMCEVACQKNNDAYSCRRTSELHQMKNISGLKLRPGSPCNDFQGYCDVFQRCRAVDAEGPLAMLKNLLFNQHTLMTIKQWAMTYWWACMLMLVALMVFMAAFIKCCAVHTPSSNPKKKPALRISDTLRRPADTLRRKRNRPNQQQGRNQGSSHPQASCSNGPGPGIPLQPSAPPPPDVSSHFGPNNSGSQLCSNLQVHPQLPQSQQSTSFQNVMHPSVDHHVTRYLAEPPPPYPGIIAPAIPPRPSNRSSVASATGPVHGYGEGRGHYNRRSSHATSGVPMKPVVMTQMAPPNGKGGPAMGQVPLPNSTQGVNMGVMR